MVKPIDFSKLLKSATSKIEGISVGFHDPSTWITTGNYALNHFISNRFDRGIPLGQVTILAGESGAGKSLIASNVMRNALEQGIIVIVFDTEYGLTKEWLNNTGINVDEYEAKGQFIRYQVAMIDVLAKTVSEVMKSIKNQYKTVDADERPKVLFVVDSLSMLMTNTDVAQFEAGDLKGDMGRTPKALKAFVKNCVIQFAEWDIGLLCTNHTYPSQDMFSPDDNIAGGSGPVYAASIVVAMKKAKLKEDEVGNKISEVRGIRSKIMVRKSRYAQPFRQVEIKIPYSSGIDPYAGLVDLFEEQHLLEKDGNKLKYTSISGEEFKHFRKYWVGEEGKTLLDRIMAEYNAKLSTLKTAEQDLLPEMEEINDGT
jgi:RecA/RadA recombinase